MQFLRPTCHRLHWLLDVSFGEDVSPVRWDNAPQNLSLLKKIILNLIRLDATDKTKKRRLGRDSQVRAEGIPSGARRLEQSNNSYYCSSN